MPGGGAAHTQSRRRRNLSAMSPERRVHYIRWLADNSALPTDTEFHKLVWYNDELTYIEKGGATHGPQAHA